MKPAFYTCPIQAAYMAKHFGMRFHTGGGDFCDITVYADPRGYADNHHGLWKDKWFIHPKSMEIIVLQIGDLISAPHGSTMLYTGSTDPDTERCRIILRNGTPFLWPEFEK